MGLQNLIQGFKFIFQGFNIFYIIFGVGIGTVIGALPGLGAGSGIALAIGAIFGMDPGLGVILLVGLYMGTAFGGAISAILINTPGIPGSVLTAQDGYPLALERKGGSTVGLAAIGSFLGSLISIIILTLSVPYIAKIALGFGPAEYTSLIILGLTSVAFITGDSFLKGLLSAAMGAWLALIGVNSVTGHFRFTFRLVPLMGGISFVVVAMGLFALSEIFLNVEKGISESLVEGEVGNVYPSKKLLKRVGSVFIKAPLVGTFVGVLPAAGQSIAAFISYIICQRTSSKEEKAKFGSGSPLGVVAAEGANSATTGGALLTTLILGVPGTNAMALILGYMITAGLNPGPLFFKSNLELGWAIIASLYVGSIVLLLINLPLAPHLSRLILSLPYSKIYPILLFLLITGSFTLINATYNIYLMIGFGVLGYFMKKLKLPRPPLLLALVLLPIFESNLSRTLSLGRGTLSLFLQRPVSLIFLGLAVIFAGTPYLMDRIKERFEKET